MKNIYLKGVIMSELVMKERISVLKDKMLSEKRYASIEQAKIITDTYKQHEDEPNHAESLFFKELFRENQY